MIVGCPKEIKIQEYRVGLTPAMALLLKQHGHTVLVQRGAGAGSGISDEAYIDMGAELVDTIEDVYRRADFIIKVKEPLPLEYELMREEQIIYTYFHLAAVPELAKVLVEKKITAIAYETIQLDNGHLPLLQPMSEVAGRMATQEGATWLEKEKGGKGILLGGVPGVKRGNVAIIGGGVVGTNAAKMAVGLGADVTILDINLERLNYLDDIFGGRVRTLYSDITNLTECVKEADLLIGAVLIAGAKAPKLVTEEMVALMEDGSVIVDVAVDQGGCIETCEATNHEDPVFVKHGVLHYCVANMPGAVPRTSTFALTNATISYLKIMAEQGVYTALRSNKALRLGLNTMKGFVTHAIVARDLGYDYVDPATLL